LRHRVFLVFLVFLVIVFQFNEKGAKARATHVPPFSNVHSSIALLSLAILHVLCDDKRTGHFNSPKVRDHYENHWISRQCPLSAPSLRYATLMPSFALRFQRFEKLKLWRCGVCTRTNQFLLTPARILQDSSTQRLSTVSAPPETSTSIPAAPACPPPEP